MTTNAELEVKGFEAEERTVFWQLVLQESVRQKAIAAGVLTAAKTQGGV